MELSAWWSKVCYILRWVAVFPTFLLVYTLLGNSVFYILSILDYMASVSMERFSDGMSSPILIDMISCFVRLFISIIAAAYVAPTKRFATSVTLTILYALLLIVGPIVIGFAREFVSKLPIVFLILEDMSAVGGCVVACRFIKNNETSDKLENN